jgi:hypothetical protein
VPIPPGSDVDAIVLDFDAPAIAEQPMPTTAVGPDFTTAPTFTEVPYADA